VWLEADDHVTVGNGNALADFYLATLRVAVRFLVVVLSGRDARKKDDKAADDETSHGYYSSLK
jgi:hypothetical protein